MRLGIGLGLFKSGALSVGLRIFSAYKSRVIGDGGTVESGTCVINGINGSTILQQASLLLIPSGYKSGVAYSEIPTNGNGDLTWSRASTANRTNSSGNIELMNSGVPRLSYMYGSCPALLAEPQRTNLCLWSEDFTNVGWSKTNTTVSGNTTISPDGTQNADTITITNSGSNLLFRQITVTASTTYTFSFWALRGTATDLKYLVYNYSGASILVASTSYYSQTNSSTWSRINVTFTTPVGCTLIGVYPIIDVVTTGTVFLFGAQLEAGAYPTTYIPTTTASATRVADSFSRSNIYTNGLISASGGTWFVELRNNVEYLRSGVTTGLSIGDTSSGVLNGICIRNASPSPAVRLTVAKMISGTLTSLFTTSTDTTKIAIKWNGTSADVFVNGTKQVSATAFTTTVMEYLLCDSADVPKFIQQMALFPTPLSDAQCQTLTT